ncbi:hypothetical protein SanaruYs_14930 [Chryseotalea sanaruensis]|uniref:Uncharacterized protein n=1 Tax=Chryseotalea sanaruensis TaxID=2482724 RepID=A0A401U8P7_9BACT|nr:hypothetical protein [Chryseotalea sanaruensis]GCC51272.1 hypothetical protein SanaruYs_14930 [Chryseotalea sanaruensis]
MLSDSTIYDSGGTLSSGVENNSSINAVITFIKEHFDHFAEQNKGQTSINEKGLTQKLCIFLNRSAREQPFFFHSEFMEDVNIGTSAQVDIGTLSYSQTITIVDRDYSDDDSFFSIEAKRLPTPGTGREREYVIGESKPSGGIERFKKGLHGSRLKFSAIIAYVQKENFDFWFLKINSWIQELAKQDQEGLWSNLDQLNKTSNVKDSAIMLELSSTNSRKAPDQQLDSIQLFHFWISLV